jgi:hypothetical protein
MGSKSTPSTTTTVNQNPVGQAQAGYLQNAYNTATSLAGIGNGSNQVFGQDYLNQLNAMAQANANASGMAGQTLLPQANNVLGQFLGGNFNQGGYAGGPQIGAMGNIAGQLQGQSQDPRNTGIYFANQIGGAAANAPGMIAPYQSALGGLAGQFGNLAQAGYGAQQGLQNIGAQAMGTGQGYGQALQSIGGGAMTGGNQALGALGGLSGAAQNIANPAQNQLYANSGMAISGNPIYNSLMGMAGGQYINPSTNPAMAGMLQTATQPLVNQYQTAIAPQLASNFENAGRYGSGAQTNAQGQAQYGLGQALQGATSGIVNNAYNQGLQATLGAGQALGSAYNQGLANSNAAAQAAGQLGQSGVQLAGNLLNQGYGLQQQGYQTGANAFNAGAGAANAGFNTGAQAYSGGAGALQGLAGTGLQGASTNYQNAGQLGLSGLNSMMQGFQNAGNVANQGYATSGNMLGQAGNIQGQAGQVANTGQLGLGGVAQMTPDMANYPLSQLSTAFNTAWAPVQNAAAIFGSPIGGNTTSQQTTPYYTNTGQQVMSGLGSLASMAALFKI